MIISFGWTADYLPPRGTKNMTRRIWAPSKLASWQSAWDKGQREHDALDKKIADGGTRIGTVVLTERPFIQRLGDMPPSDVVREGGMVETVEEFIFKYFEGDREKKVVVVEFEFVPLASNSGK